MIFILALAALLVFGSLTGAGIALVAHRGGGR